MHTTRLLHPTLTPPTDYLHHEAVVPYASYSTSAQPYSPNAHSYPTPASAKTPNMTTPHRGLPPPLGMTLAEPARGPPQLPLPMDALPPAPQQWSGSAEDSMRNWLRAKEEEDRRKQEEEKTRQEELKLEQRRIEQTMLRDSLSSGIPPHLVPVIFAGLAGGPLAQLGLDLVQQHLVQLQQTSQPPPPPLPAFAASLQTSPDMRREGSGSIARYAPPTQQTAPLSTSLPPNLQQATVYPSPAYQSPAAKALYAPPNHSTFNVLPAPKRTAAQAALPHLTTNEVAPQSTASFSQQQQQQEQAASSSSPSIYFHHWQPPGSSNKDGEKKTSPNVPNQPTGDEVRESPSRKRKAAGHHQPAPMPKQASPAPSSTSSGSKGHVRRQSGELRRAYDPIGDTRQHRGTNDFQAMRTTGRRASSPAPRAE